jgi:cellulose synthase (UDP-forming)
MISQVDSQGVDRRRGVRRLRVATLVLVGIFTLCAVIVTAWFTGEDRVSEIFAQIQLLQENPPMWLAVPMVMGEYLLAPTVVLFLTVVIVTKVSPQPRIWARRLVVSILLILTIRYILWRSLSTLNVADPLNGVFSLGLFFVEGLILLSGTIQLFLMLNVSDRHREADQCSLSVIDGSFTPTVDILIPTYNEPEFILERTIIGCQALDYAFKTIYLLDDTKRPEIKKLAQQLGCEYIIRPNNNYAKAGNLNHAIRQSQGELIVVFDADFVPTKNFLTRTVGFFQDNTVALIQTPQSFYNFDPITRNLGLENVLTSEEEVFYRQIQPIRDAAGSVVCSGTSFVVRRSALEMAGGFVTDSLSEDYFTGIRLSAQGYRLVYLNEKLSAGLAAENIAAHATQRLRWAQGTLQGFFISANPLTIPGLTPLQRLAHLEGLLHWFTSISRVGFLIMPLAYSFLNIIPIRATIPELLYFFLPYYLVQLTVFAWLNGRSRSALLSDVYSLVLCFPLALNTIQVMLRPFSRGFKVTPKGTTSDRYTFNWKLASPLIILFVATAISLWRNLGMCIVKGAWVTSESQHLEGINLGWIWSAYNLIAIAIALLILIDVPNDLFAWFYLRRIVQLKIANKTFWGITTMLSEVGAEVMLTQSISSFSHTVIPVTLEIMEEKLILPGQIKQIKFDSEFPTLRISFETLDLTQQRQLVEMLFCRPGQWKVQNTPGELASLFLIFKILLRPRVLFHRSSSVSAIKVAQV